MTKKLTQICNNSGLRCDDFGYSGGHKHLPTILKYSPQHVVYDSVRTRLVYFRPAYDSLYVELFRDEVSSLRMWNSNIHPVLIVVFNYPLNKYTTFDMDFINKNVFNCRKESIDKFLIEYQRFEWRKVNEKLILG